MLSLQVSVVAKKGTKRGFNEKLLVNLFSALCLYNILLLSFSGEDENQLYAPFFLLFNSATE